MNAVRRWLTVAALMVATGQAIAGVTLDQLLAERARRQWLKAPDAWVAERCHEFVWSKQREVLRSITEHRKTAVPSCHSAGKSFLAGRAAAHWLSNHPVGQAFVVTSAPNTQQVRAVLWREINRVHAKANLPGRTNQTEWLMTSLAGREELVGFGRKPANMDATGFQGIHARFVLVIFDEATGIPGPLWDAADSLIANEESRMLAIGNPTDPTSEFEKACRPGSGWNVVPISAFDTPNFTGEAVPDELTHLLISRTYQEECLRKWGESNPMYVSRVLGKFPKRVDGGLFPIDWIAAAQARWEDTPKPVPPERSQFQDGADGDKAFDVARLAYDRIPHELGVDVGGGGDESTVCHRHGAWARIVHSDRNPDTMQTTGAVVKLLEETKARRAKVDNIGIGRGVVDRAREQNKPVVGVNVSLPPDAHDPEAREGFLNLRAEYYWALREIFRAELIAIDPADEDLAAELAALRYKVNSLGKIQIESKDDMRKRGLASPNRADALMLAFAVAGRQPGDLGIS